MKPSVFWKSLAAVVSLAAVYFGFAKLGLTLSPASSPITPVWPPAGIAVAGLLVLGYRVWPGIFLGALAVELTTSGGLGTAFLIAVANTVESLAGAWVVNRFAGGRNFYTRPWDALKFAALVGLISPLISPPPGGRILAPEDFLFWRGDGTALLTWWLGEMVSLLVLTPLIVVWAVEPRWARNRWKALEFGLLILLLVVVGEGVFGGLAPASVREYLFPYLCLPFLFWAAFRFGQRETITATFVLGTVVMSGVLQGYGFFERVSPGHALLVDHGFMVITSVLSMALAAVVGQRRRAVEELEKYREHLEALVRQRTSQLEAANTELQRRIMERNRAEEALRESEYRYARAQQAANIGSWDWNMQTGQLHWSEQIEPLFGFARGQFGRSYEAFLECVHPEDRTSVSGAVDAALKGQRDYAVEHRVVWPDGTIRWVAEAGEVQRDARGAPARMLGIVRDITARKETERALRESEQRYRSLFSGMTEGFALHEIVCNEDGEPCDYRFLEVNAAFERMTGLKREDVIGRLVRELLPDDHLEWVRIYGSVALTGQPAHFERFSPALSRHYEVYAYCPAPRQFAVLFMDVTERKRMEEVLQRNEATMRGILDAAKESILLFSPDGRVLLANATTFQRLGHPAEAVIGRQFSEILPAELARTRLKRLREVVESGRPLEFEDERSSIKFRHNFYPVLDGEGRVNSIACFSRDITEQKKAEQALAAAYEEVQTANKHLQSVTHQLRVSNETLERRVKERTENLHQANRILRMISECGQALVHLSNEQELIQRICRTIHETGGYRMVWVGFADNDLARTVRPIGAVGFDEGYLQEARITWADNRHGRGPTGTAIRTGKACTGRDFLSAPELAPWREMALARGFQSSIALPLLAEGRAFGALSIYAAEPDAFGSAEIELLTELADDLSFGLTALRVQAERDRARTELEQKAGQLRALAGELIYAEQRERRRLAQILHDRLQQLLVGARYNLESLRTQSQEDAFQDTVHRIDGFLDECIKMSRSLTAELSPPVLYEAGLAAALKWLGRWFQETHGLTVRVTVDEQTVPESEELRVTLFQAVRELLFNVVKHAKVKQAEVQLSRPAKDRVRILVSDKGAGFELTTLQAQEGKTGRFGLFSLRERLESLGGQLEIESAPGRGSRFVLSVTSQTAASKDAAGNIEPLPQKPQAGSPWPHSGLAPSDQ